jgi:DNA-directed RNA polymerase omega subunit
MLLTSKDAPGAERLSPATAQTATPITGMEQWPGIVSRFQLVVVVALRSKQLQRGARPRIEADPRKRKNTSIALEEIKQGLVPFTTVAIWKIEESTMYGLRVYLNRTNKPCSAVMFYSRRDDGPYYCWRYEEELERWCFSRVCLPRLTLRTLRLMTWRAVPVSLQAELYDHYLE